MPVKLKDLTERELLILLNEKVERLENEMALQQSMSEKLSFLENQVIELRVKYQIWIAAVGFIASIAGAFVQKLVILKT